MIDMLEDDGGIRDFVLYALNNSGFEAVGFELPSEFFSALSENIPDLLLLDVMLPEEDGISILKKLRNFPKTEKLPVILLTAKGTEFDKVNGLDSGADDYISKPFSFISSHQKLAFQESYPIHNGLKSKSLTCSKNHCVTSW